MAEYDDPLAALPTVAPPRVKKKQDALASPDGGGLSAPDDYFGSFPSDDPVGGQPYEGGIITHTTDEFTPDLYPTGMPFDGTITERVGPGGLVPGPEGGGMPWDGDPVNAMALPEGPLGDFGRDAIDRARRTGLLPPDPGVAPVPGGDQGMPRGPETIPGGGGSGLPPESGTPGDLDAYIRYLLENPTRYDDDMVRQGLENIDATLADKRQGAMSEIEEMMAQRGLVGSSVEANTAAELGEDLERQRKDYAFDLQREMATTRMQDMQAAGQLAVAHRANELRERGMNLDDAYRQAALEFEQTKFFGDEGSGFPGTFAQEQYLAELDAYYQTLSMLAQTGMDSDDLKRWQQQNPRPQPVGGVPEGYEIPESEYESWLDRVQRQAREAEEAKRQRQEDNPNFWDDWFNQG